MIPRTLRPHSVSVIHTGKINTTQAAGIYELNATSLPHSEQVWAEREMMGTQAAACLPSHIHDCVGKKVTRNHRIIIQSVFIMDRVCI